MALPTLSEVKAKVRTLTSAPDVPVWSSAPPASAAGITSISWRSTRIHIPSYDATRDTTRGLGRLFGVPIIPALVGVLVVLAVASSLSGELGGAA